MRRLAVLAVLLAALLTAACGGASDGATTSAAGPTEAECNRLLSLDDVAGLFADAALFDTQTSESVEGFNCVWQSPAASIDAQRQVLQIQVYDGEDFYVADQYLEVEALPGIGDEAFFSPELGVSLGYRQGTTVVAMTYSVIGTEATLDPMTRKDQVIALLRLVHDRLG